MRVFAGFDPLQRTGDLSKLFGHLDVEGLEQLLIFELDGLFRKILRQWLVAMPRLFRDAVVALQQFVLAGQKAALDLVLIDHMLLRHPV